jgi:hypothetical protein
MGLPVTGAWARKYQLQVPYTDARRWGTGINPIHAYRGDTSRPDNAKLAANQMDPRLHTHAHVATEEAQDLDYGYNPEDVAGLDVFNQPEWQGVNGPGVIMDNDHPNWQTPSDPGGGTIGDPPTGGAPGPVNPAVGVNRGFIPPEMNRWWGMSGAAKNRLRGIRGGQTEADTGWQQRGTSSEIPMETVSEGWLNKPSTGMDMGHVPDDDVYGMVSDPAQYERNTSMQQRHKTQNNQRAVMRGQDMPRSEIPSRIAPQKLKVYSGQQRHYDMFPYQIDDMPRGFQYRTAGVGPTTYLETNEQWTRTPMQRTPPPDPSMGMPDTEVGSDGNTEYGYSNEDQGYY